MCLEISNNLLLVLQDAPTRDLLVSQKTTQRHFIFTLHPLSTVLFATATVLAFVLLRNSSFSFHCYSVKQHLLRNQPGSALRPLTTSLLKDYKAHSLQQTSFAESPNTRTCSCCALIEWCVLCAGLGLDSFKKYDPQVSPVVHNTGFLQYCSRHVFLNIHKQFCCRQ